MNKQLITSILAVLFSVATSFASATEPSIISNGKSFSIDTKIWKSETVDVSISDMSGTIIFSDTHQISTSKKYSLKNLPMGDYQVTVSNDFKSVVNDINITRKDIFVDYSAETIYKPVLNISDNNIDVNFLANGKTQMYIYNDTETVYNKTFSGERTINKRFNISNLEQGTYSVVITNNNKTYSKLFNKK